jgi:hypothetical protein
VAAHATVDELQELDFGMNASQVDLDPLLIDDPPAIGQLGVLGPGPGIAQGPLDDAW